MRGDDIGGLALWLPVHGTPPRARGRLSDLSTLDLPGRNTPACAGTTHCRLAGLGGIEEHPRVRGDDGPLNRTSGALHGTPPRARGRRFIAARYWVFYGNTPACAGTTAIASSPSRAPFGTPPRARGRQGVASESA